MGVQTLVFIADGNKTRCDAAHLTIIILICVKLTFYAFLLERGRSCFRFFAPIQQPADKREFCGSAIIVLSLGANARRWCYRGAAAGLVVGLSLFATFLYVSPAEKWLVIRFSSRHIHLSVTGAATSHAPG